MPQVHPPTQAAFPETRGSGPARHQLRGVCTASLRAELPQGQRRSFPSSQGRSIQRENITEHSRGCPISTRWDGPVTSKARAAQQGRADLGLQSWECGPEAPELPRGDVDNVRHVPEEKNPALQRQHMGTSRRQWTCPGGGGCRQPQGFG